MRNQVAAAERAGVHAATINSSNVADWDEIHERVRRGDLDVLLVSPERLNNPDFRDRGAARAGTRRRPRGRRRGALRVRLGPRLPARLPAHPHADRRTGRRHPGAGHHGHRQRPGGRRRRRRQLGVGGQDTLVLRGGLDRESLRLSVVNAGNPAAARGLACRAHRFAARLGHRLHADRRAGAATWRHCCASRVTGWPPTPVPPKPPNANNSRPICWPTASRRWSRRRHWAWVSTSPTSASSCTSALRPRRSPTTSRSAAPAGRPRAPR